jgi:Ca2+-binding EF-hand superfamily protein
LFIFKFQGYTEEEATERAMEIFGTLDKNRDGSLAEDEFIKVTQNNFEPKIQNQ